MSEHPTLHDLDDVIAEFGFSRAELEAEIASEHPSRLTTTILKPDATHMVLRHCPAGWCTEWRDPETGELVAATRPTAGCACREAS